MAVEDIFYGKNVRTTVLLGHTRGAVLLAAALRGTCPWWTILQRR
jgi:Holliday junction resolvasome RuvABC endonuclease subunit